MNNLVKHRCGTELSPTAIEDLIVGVLRLRKDAAEIGLPKTVTYLDYAYYEILLSLREDRDRPSTPHPLPLTDYNLDTP